MKIFDPHITGSLNVSASANIQGDLIVSGTIYGSAQITGQVDDAVSASHAASYLLTSSFESYTGSVAITGSNTFIGDQTISGSLLPQGTLTHDLGSDSQRWRDIYLAGNTINLGGTKITKNDDGDVEVKDSSNNLKKIVASEIEIGSGNSKKVLKVDNGKFKLMDSADTKDEAAALSGSFTGSFVGDGSRLVNVPASAVQGLSLNKIADGAVTASIGNGKMTLNANFEPDLTDTRDLGSPTKQWRDLFLSSGSLYINGQQVLSTTGNELRVTTDEGESIKILETGSDTITLQTENGDITLTSSGNGNIELDAPIQIGAGNKILSSDGNSIHFGNGLIVTGSIVLSGTVDGVDIADLKSNVDAILAGSSADKDSFAEIVSLINSVDTTNDEAFASHYTSSNNRLSSLETTSGSHDGRIDSLETFSGSINTTIKSKLDSENVVSGSEFVLNSTTPILQYVDVTVTQSGGVYYIDGVQQQIVSLAKGLIYRFDVSDSSLSGHPFRFSLPDDTQYTDGVTVNGTEGSSGAYVQIIVNQDTPQTLQYYCTNHNGMGNKVFVGGAGDTDSITEGSNNLYYTDGRVKTKLNTEGVVSGSEQITISDTTGYSTLDGRIDSLETFTGSLDLTYASDQDVSDLRDDLNSYTSSNDLTIGNVSNDLGNLTTDFNTYTSSNDININSIQTLNTTQNNRLSSIETKTGSLSNDITSHNIRLNSLETVSGSHDGRLDSLELKSGSLEGEDTLQNLRLGSLESTSGSHDSRLDSLETKSGSLEGEDTLQNLRLGSLESFTASIDDTYATDSDVSTLRGDFNTYTSSNDDATVIQNDRISSLESTSGSHNTRLNNLETFETKVDGGLEFTGSNVTIKGDLLVKGTETRVDSTTVEVSDNIISLNGSGAVNGGIEVRDTTSPGVLSGSLLWDSSNNHWIGGTKGSEERILTTTDLTSLDNDISGLDGRLDSIEIKTGSLDSTNTTQNSRLTSLESFTGSIDNTYASDEDVTDLRNDLNTYTSSNDTLNNTQTNRLNALETTSGSHGSRIGSLESADSDQDNRLQSLESKTGSLDNDISGLDGRLDSVESFTASIDSTYATDSDVSTLRGDFNSYTSSNDSDISSIQTLNTTQNSRLNSLESKTGSLDGDISTLDGRIDSLEVESGSIRGTFNSYTSSNNTLNTTQNSRLTSLESATGSYLTEHPNITPAPSSNNSGRTYIQDVLLDSNGHVTGLTTGTETVVNTDEYVTGASWNNSTAVLSFTRNDGDTFNVTLLDTLSDVTVTGGTYDSGTQTLELTKNDGSTISVSGFAIDTDINYYTTGATFNNSNGVLTLGIKGTSDVTVDLDGRYLTGYTETDPIFSASPSAGITNTNISNWNTAYGWGDHSVEGYVTNDEYTTGATFNSGNGIITFTRNDGDTFTVDIDGRYLTSYTETDTLDSVADRGNTTNQSLNIGEYISMSSAQPKIKLIETDTTDKNKEILVSGGGLYIRNLNDDGSVGSNLINVSNGGNLNVTGTISASGYNDSNWNTAYGWGDHSTEGYLTSYNNEYTTGASFNTSTGVLTFTRNDGDTYDVDLDNRYLQLTGGSLSSLNMNGDLNIRWSGTDTTSYELFFYNQSYHAKIYSTGGDLILTNGTGEKMRTTSSGISVTGSVTATGGNSSQWNTAYGWGDHSVEGYVTNDEYTTGATFNSGNGVITFTRNDGDTFTVDIDGRYLTSYTETDTLSSVTSRGSSTSTAVTFSGGLTASGGINGLTLSNGISGTNFNITGVNQLEIADPGEGIVFKQGSSGDITLAIVDDSNDNILNLSGTGASFSINGATVATQSWVSSRNYLTSHPSIAGVSSNNSGRTYIQDILTDSNGHVTGITTATETVVNTDEYTTGATFNSGNGVITFTRNDGDTYTLDISDTLSEITVTGGTYNSGTQTLTLVKSDGNSIDVSGFAVDTDINYYTTGATFNTGNGIITGTRNDGGTWTVDLDGRYLTSYTETDTLDSVADRGNSTNQYLQASYFQSTGSQLLRRYSSGWTYTTHDVVYNGWTSSTGDYTYLKSAGNSSGGHGIIAVGDNGFWIGRTDLETGALTDSSTNPIGYTLLRSDSSGNVTISGTITASGYNKSNWDTAYGWGNHASVGYLTSHPTIPGASSNNSGRTYIQDVLTDSNGHVTGLTTATETVVNTDTNYYTTGATFNTGNGIITGTRNDGGTWTVDIDGRYLTSYTETSTLSDVVGRGNYFGNSQSGFVTNNTWGSEFRRIKRITFTSGGSNWDTDNHGIFSTDASGNYNDSMSVNSFNDLTFRVDTNSNNNTSYVRFMQHSTGAGTEWFRSGFDGGQYINLFRQGGYVAFEGLNLAISNSNSTHGFNNYFRGDSTHLVIGTGGTLYLNYGQSSGNTRIYGNIYLNDTIVLNSSRVLQNVSGNISMFTNDSGYLTSHPSIAGVSSNNSGRTYIQDILTDSNGHVTGITTGTETVTNTDTNYYLNAISWNSSNGIITLGRQGLSSLTLDIDGRYAQYGHQTSTNSDFNNVRTSGIYTLDYGGQANANSPDGGAWHALWHARSGGTRQAQITIPYNNDNIYFRRAHNSTAETWYDWVKIWHEGNDGAGSGLDSDTLDGQQGSYYLDYNNFTNKPTIGNGTMTISAGGGMSGGGSFTANQTGSSSVTISHADTSSQASSNNSGRTYIQDVLLDGYGHVTGLTTATETVVNTDTVDYITSATFNTGNGIITGSGVGRASFSVDIDGRYLPYGGGTITGDLQVNGHIRGGGQQLVLNAGESHLYATGQTAEYIYLNAEQGLEINSETGNWSGGWAARKTAYLRGDQLTLDGESLTKTNIQNFKTAYGWGNHATQGYVTNDEYVTGATWNSGNAVLTFTRNDGDTFNVTLLNTLSDVTVTGGTYNSGNQTLTLTKSDGTTVAVSGFAVDTDVNWYTTSASFNTGNGIITGTRNDGGTWTVDIDGRYLPLGGGTLTGTVSLGELRIGEHAVHGGYWGLWNSEASTSTTQQYMIISAGTDTYINGDNVYIRAGNNSNSNEVKVTTGGTYIGGNKVATESWVTSNPTHPSISAASSSNNSGRTYIQDILLDGNGHVTGITTGTETVTNTDTNYYTTSATFNTGNGIITGTRNDGGTWTVDLDGRYLTAESDTLATVTARGSSTSSNIYLNNASPTLYLQDTDNRSAMIHVNSNYFYILNGSANNSTSWAQQANSRWLFQGNLNNNDITFGGSGDFAGVVTATGGNSNNWNTAYTYSQVGHLPLAGGTMSGSISMGNNTITNVESLTFNDPGPTEGIIWAGGSGFKIVESPNDLSTNTGGNLQFAVGSTRILTLGSNGESEFTDKLTLTSSTSGSTIFDIQGTSGQLFSITDDLTGDLFSVSDASGVPILNVNANGSVTLDPLGSLYVGDNKVINGSGNIEFDGPVTTTNQGRGIYWTAYDKEGTTDASDTAHILHTTNSGGLSGSVIEIKSHNDAADGVNFIVNATDSGVRINGSAIATQTWVGTNTLNQTEGDARYAQLTASNSFTNSYNEFGNSTGSVSNDGSWNARVNVAGSSHARLDVKSVSDGIITSMYAHTGQNVGKIGTYSNHSLQLMVNSTGVVTIDSSGNISTSGTLSASGYNKSNWDDAHGWGDHSGLYLPIGGGTITGDLVVGGGDLTISKDGNYSTISFPAQTNDAGFIRHYESNNTARMEFSVSDDSGTTDQFHFGYSGDLDRFIIYSNGSFLSRGSGTIAGSLGLQGDLDMSAGTTATLAGISGTDQVVENNYGAYLHLGGWAVGRTDASAVLVNTAYRADYATSLFDMNISRFTNDSGYALRKSTTFTNLTTVTFTHGIGHDNVIVQVYDGNGDLFFPSRVNVQGGVVEVNFEVARSGRLVVVG